MPVVGNQDGTLVEPRKSRREQKADRATAKVTAAGEERKDSRRGGAVDALDAVAMLRGQGERVFIRRTYQEAVKQTAIHEETRDLMKQLVDRMGPTDDAGHL